ncbi:MAG: ABC transporter ATP-binding protein [Ferruginibacter sp.]
MSSIIQVSNLSKSYIISHEGGERYTALRDVVSKKAKGIFGGRKKSETTREEFWALKDINFEVEEGDRVGIIGRNGAGKSTLLKVLSRITEPTTGNIRIKGRVASLLEVGTGFHPELTGRENIFLNGAILGMSRSDIKKHFDAIVDFAEIEKFLDTPVKRYSSGMYMRLAFAVAAHLEPEILIVDEVLAVGDAQFQKKCLGKMEDVSKNEGRTVLFVSHNIGVMKHLCNKGVLLENGKLQFHGDMQRAASAYTDVFAKTDFENYKHIAGNQDIRIDKLIVNNSDDIEIFGQIKLSIYFSTNRQAEKLHRNFHFFVLFYNDSGEVVWSVFQKDNEAYGNLEKGVVKVSMENILAPGRYMISTGIFDQSNQFIDWVEKVEVFEVLPVFKGGKSFDSRYGAVTTKANWEISA